MAYEGFDHLLMKFEGDKWREPPTVVFRRATEDNRLEDGFSEEAGFDAYIGRPVRRNILNRTKKLYVIMQSYNLKKKGM